MLYSTTQVKATCRARDEHVMPTTRTEWLPTDGEKRSNPQKPKVTPEVGRGGRWVLERLPRLAERQGDEVDQKENKTEQAVCSTLFQALRACILHSPCYVNCK
jgi:hypothetical protein